MNCLEKQNQRWDNTAEMKKRTLSLSYTARRRKVHKQAIKEVSSF